MNNDSLVHRVLLALAARGVAQIVICAGARNAPFVFALADSEGFELHSHFEERAAGFFALGVARRTGRPVAVVTTSGTAVAELLPAVIEAHYSGVPLLVVSADRPRRFRGTGAPQCIEQVGLFGNYVQCSFDLSVEDDENRVLDGLSALSCWPGTAPAHLNICLNEPAREGAKICEKFRPALPASVEPDKAATRAAALRINQFLSEKQAPVVVVGALPREAVAAVARFLQELSLPVYAEAHSGVRGHAALESLELISGEQIFSRYPECDGVLRIGGVPTLRFWRDLEERCSHIPVLSVSELPYGGLSRGEMVQGSLAAVFAGENALGPSRTGRDLLVCDQEIARALQALLNKYPQSEPALLREFSAKLGDNDLLFLGNSLPVREWDLVAIRKGPPPFVLTNRGANGIDGQLSTFLGLASPSHPMNWALVGDLTALYDLAAPWICRKEFSASCTIVVVNNGGGKIFSRLFGSAAFENGHQLQFRSWAEQWDWAYEVWKSIPQEINGGHKQRVVEIQPDPETTQQFWEEYDTLWLKL